MEENKVTISLKEYIELYKGQKENDKEKQILLELILKVLQLNHLKMK